MSANNRDLYGELREKLDKLDFAKLPPDIKKNSDFVLTSFPHVINTEIYEKLHASLVKIKFDSLSPRIRIHIWQILLDLEAVLLDREGKKDL